MCLVHLHLQQLHCLLFIAGEVRSPHLYIIKLHLRTLFSFDLNLIKAPKILRWFISASFLFWQYSVLMLNLCSFVLTHLVMISHNMISDKLLEDCLDVFYRNILRTVTGTVSPIPVWLLFKFCWKDVAERV